MGFLYDLLFGCWHENFSFPQKSKHDTYVACLDCGKEFEYDWNRMRIVGERVKFEYVAWYEDAEETVARESETHFDAGFLKAMRVKF